MQLFESLYRQGNTILVVTHEEEIAHHARRVIRLRDGVVESDRRITEPTLADSELTAAMAL
jgi:putative ABC transport system ATP-binding protein